MSKYLGRKVNIGIGKETNRGVGVAAAHWIPHSTLTFFDRVLKARPYEAIGSIALAPTTAIPTERWAEGNIEGEVNINSFGLLLLALFGTSSPSSVSGAYEHTYTLQEDNQHDSLSIYQITPDEDILFELAMLNSLEIIVEPGEVVRFVAHFISKASADTDETESYTRDYKFVARDLTVKVANTTGDLAAASKVKVKRLNILFEKNVERDIILGSFDPDDILNKGMSISGSIELAYNNNTYKDYMLDGNVRALQIKLYHERIALGTNYPELDMQFAKVEFDEWEPAYDIDEIVRQTINFNVLYDLANDKLWSSIVLTNTTASY